MNALSMECPAAVRDYSSGVRHFPGGESVPPPPSPEQPPLAPYDPPEPAPQAIRRGIGLIF